MGCPKDVLKRPWAFPRHVLGSYRLTTQKRCRDVCLTLWYRSWGCTDFKRKLYHSLRNFQCDNSKGAMRRSSRRRSRLVASPPYVDSSPVGVVPCLSTPLRETQQL